MCEWCEKEKKKNGGSDVGIICPRMVGDTVGYVIRKRLRGEKLSETEVGLLDVFAVIAGVLVK